MLLFAVIYNIAEMVVTLVAVFQFLATLFTGSPNQRLLSFGETLSRYFYHVMRFLTFASDDRPFPFRDWPGRPEAPRQARTTPKARMNPNPLPTAAEPKAPPVVVHLVRDTVSQSASRPRYSTPVSLEYKCKRTPRPDSLPERGAERIRRRDEVSERHGFSHQGLPPLDASLSNRLPLDEGRAVFLSDARPPRLTCHWPRRA